MPPQAFSVQIEVSGGKLTAAAKARIQRAVRSAFQVVPRSDAAHKLLRSRPWQVHVQMVSRVKIQGLNRQYRHKDKATDVLSFPLWMGEWVSVPGQVAPLGDIVICPQVARDQCKEWGNTFLQELVRLSVHGALHLLDYDHERGPREAKKMQSLEKKALRSLIPAPNH